MKLFKSKFLGVSSSSIILIIAFIAPLINATSTTNTGDYWVTKASLNQPRSVLGVAVANNKIYAIGGSIESGYAPSIAGNAVYSDMNIDGFVGTNEMYDSGTNMWSNKSSMPTPRIAFGTAVLNNKIYCIGGRYASGSSGFTGINEVYDATTDKWETKAPMPVPRAWVTAGVVGGKIYVIGGGSNGVTNEVYDPVTDSWASKSPAPQPVYGGGGSVSAVVENKIYVIGYLIEVYNPDTDTWLQKNSAPPMGPASSPITAAGVIVDASRSNKIYVFGPNWDPYNPSDSIYDPINDSWSNGASFPTQSYNFGVAVLNNTFYAIGGHIYNPGRGGYFEPVGLNQQYIPTKSSTATPSPSPEPSSSPKDSTSPLPLAWLVAIPLLVIIAISTIAVVLFRLKNGRILKNKNQLASATH